MHSVQVHTKKISNKRALILLFTANGISGFAQGITMLSVPWYFAQQDASSQFNFMYGLITFLTVFWGLFAGTLVDRFDRKSVFLINNAAEGFILLSVALYGFVAGGLSVALIILAFASTIMGFYLHYPNLYAFAQEVSPVGAYTKVTSYIEIVGQTTNVLAGAMAALLLEGANIDKAVSLLGTTFTFSLTIDKWAMHEIFLMDGITYLISIALISFITYKPQKKRVIETGNIVKRMKTGLLYLKENPLIFTFGFFSYSIFVVLLVKLHALMPLYITHHLHEGGSIFGTMEVLYALGALSAGIFVGSLFSRFTTVGSVIFLLCTATVALWLSALTQSVPIFLGVGLLIGFANAGARVLRLSYLFRQVPNGIIGRVNSLFSITNVMLRVVFIMLFSATFFSVGSNITVAYGILGAFTAFSALMLIVRYRKLVAS